jgi:hypothetical protein
MAWRDVGLWIRKKSVNAFSGGLPGQVSGPSEGQWPLVWIDHVSWLNGGLISQNAYGIIEKSPKSQPTTLYIQRDLWLWSCILLEKM